MASTIIAAMSVLLGANTKPYSRGMKKASLQTKIMQAQVQALHTVMGQFGGMLAGAFAIGKFKAIAAGVDETAKFASAIGMANEALGGYTLAANLAGVPTTQLRTGMRAMVKSLGDAMQGTGEAKDSLTALGVSMDDIKGKTPEQQFEALRAAFARTDDEMLKATATMDIFGSRNIGMRNMLEMSADEMAKVQTQAEKMGIAISGADAKQIEDMNDSVTMLGAAFDGLATGTMVKLAPEIEKITTALVEFSMDGTIASDTAMVAGTAFQMLTWPIKKAALGYLLLAQSSRIVGESLYGTNQGLNEAIESSERTRDALFGLSDASEDSTDKTRKMMEEMRATAKALREAAKAEGDVNAEIERQKRLATEAENALKSYAGSIENSMMSTVEKLTIELENLRKVEEKGLLSSERIARRREEIAKEMRIAEAGAREVGDIRSAISAADALKVELPADQEFARMEESIRRGFELGLVETESEMNRLIGNAFAMTVGKEQADAAAEADRKFQSVVAENDRITAGRREAARQSADAAAKESARASKEREDSLKQSADAIRSALETPFEAFVRELQAAEKLVTARALDPSDLVAYEKKLVDEFNKSVGGGETTTRGAFAEVDFSRVSTSALAMQGDRIQSQQLDTQQAIAKHTLETATALRKGITATASP